jgi:hypothetical protein
VICDDKDFTGALLLTEPIGCKLCGVKIESGDLKAPLYPIDGVFT